MPSLTMSEYKKQMLIKVFPSSQRVPADVSRGTRGSAQGYFQTLFYRPQIFYDYYDERR